MSEKKEKDLEKAFNDLCEEESKEDHELKYDRKNVLALFNFLMNQAEIDDSMTNEELDLFQNIIKKANIMIKKVRKAKNPKYKKKYKFDHCALNQESIDTVLSIINENNGRIFKLIQWRQAGIDLVGFFYY